MFYVGDRVRVTDPRHKLYNQVGTIVSVRGRGGRYDVAFDGDRDVLEDYQLEHASV